MTINGERKMKVAAVAVLLALLVGEFRLKELAIRAGVSISYASKLVAQLEVQGFIERRDRVIVLASNSKTARIKQLSGRYDLYRLMGGRNDQVLIALANASTELELGESMQVSYETLRRSLRKLQEIGAVRETEGGFSIADPEIRSFAEMLREEDLSGKVESYAQVLWSKGSLVIKRVPLGNRAKGVLTAFSRFPEYGVEVRTPYDYYFDPSMQLGPEEVFMHALRIARDAGEMALCGIFALKLRGRLEKRKLEELSQTLDLHTRWAALSEYLRTGATALDSRLFPPWSEFVVKARDYDVRLEDSHSEKDGSEDLFRHLGSILPKRIDLFLIGGENLRLKGLKVSTKDTDLVVQSPKDFKSLVSELTKFGYTPYPEGVRLTGRKGKYPSITLERRGQPRIDLYMKQVAGKLMLLPSMRQNTEKRRYGEVTLHLLSNEALLLLKAVSGREEDLSDIIRLSETRDFDWNKVFKMLTYEETATRKHYCTNLLQVLDVLRAERGIITPIHEKLVNHALDYWIPIIVGQKSRTVKEITRELDARVAMYQVRNRLEGLVKRGKLHKRRKQNQVSYELRDKS